jgi:Domain of unknown function (DUF3330)
MKKDKEVKIACDVCQKMIPRAAALHAEGRDYVLHFCSIECLDFWKNKKNKNKY